MQHISTVRVGFAVLYGLILIAGGVFGYVKTGSQISGVMGSLSGVIVLTLEYFLLQRMKSGDPTSGLCIAQLATTAILMVAMGIRYYKTGKFMPAGLVLTISLLMAFVYTSRIMDNSQPAVPAEGSRDKEL